MYKMSVVRQDPDLIDAFNELESKVFCLIEEKKQLHKRLLVLEKAAKEHGVKVGNHEATGDTCIIV